MTLEEFSNEFDVLVVHSLKIPSSPFNEYEKSVFLTKAQEDILKSYYRGTPLGDSFETTEEIRRYLSSIVKTDELDPIGTDIPTGISSKSAFFNLPEDLWFITYESATVDSANSNCYPNGKETTVTPVSQDQYHKIKNNPFRGPNNRQVIRLDIENDVVELIGNSDISKYTVRYISRPTPIILENLEEPLQINKQSKASECTLHEALHRTILAAAVTMAIASKTKTSDD